MQAFPFGYEKVAHFKEIFDKGKKHKTSTSQIIIFLEKASVENNKLSLGILALKKIVGKKAVHRNKAKRRFKHALLASLKKIILESGFHIKLIALTNKNTLNCPWEQVLADIEKHLIFVNKEIHAKRRELE